MVRVRNAKNPTCGLLIGLPMRKLHFALLSIVFIALAMGVYALQAGAALYQWLAGRTRRTFRIGLLGPGGRRSGSPWSSLGEKEAPRIPDPQCYECYEGCR